MDEGDRARAADCSCQPTRRRVLTVAVGLAAAVALPGCTVTDPRITSTRAPSPGLPSWSSTPTTRPEPAPPGARQLLVAEQSLADLAAAIATGPRRAELSRRQSALLASVRDAHLQHVAALGSQPPTDRPTAPSPPAGTAPSDVSRLSLARSWRRLRRQEEGQASRARRVALGTSGFDALLSGSLGVAAGSYASELGSPRPGRVTVDPAPQPAVTGLSDVQAWQSMVRELHAIVYGYQLALGRLSPTSAPARRAFEALGDHRDLRDDLKAALLARSAAAPAAAPAYVPPVPPTSPARAAMLIRRMETALTPFCGLWVAAATRSDDRVLALDTLTATVGRAGSWGAAPTVWPGWQD